LPIKKFFLHFATLFTL